MGHTVEIGFCFQARELIHVPAALETKMLKEPEGGGLIQQRYGEYTGFCDQIMCVVGLVHRDGDPQGFAGDLHQGVNDAAAGLVSGS